MIRLLVSRIDEKKLKDARECATTEANGYLLFDQRSRCYQLLFARRQMPEGDVAAGLRQGGCCGKPSEESP